MEVKEIFNQLKELQLELEDKAIKLPILQGYYDSQISDLLHYVENNKLNASQMSKVIKKLKECRELRRKIKEEYSILHSIKSNFKFTINEYPNSINADNYIVRTDILKELGFEKNEKMHFAKSDISIDESKINFTYTVDAIGGVEEISLNEGEYIFMSKPGTKINTKFKNFNKAAYNAIKETQASKKNGKVEFNQEIINYIISLSKLLKSGGGKYLGFVWRIGREEESIFEVEEEVIENGNVQTL